MSDLQEIPTSAKSARNGRTHWANDSVESLALLFGEAILARSIPIGARGEARETVEFKHTLTAQHAELPPVYSTPDS